MARVRITAVGALLRRPDGPGVRFYGTGENVELPADVAARLVGDGDAVAVDQPPAARGAVSAPSSTPAPVAVNLDALDADGLRAYAESIGLQLPGTVKKVETLRERIDAYLDQQGAGDE